MIPLKTVLASKAVLLFLIFFARGEKSAPLTVSVSVKGVQPLEMSGKETKS